MTKPFGKENVYEDKTFVIFYGSSGKWSDNVSIEQKKTAEHFVYLNNHKQIYKNEQQFSISCMGALQS